MKSTKHRARSDAWSQRSARPGGEHSETHVLLVGPPTDVRDEVAHMVRSAGGVLQESWHAADAIFLLGTAFEAGRPFDVVIVDEALTGVDAPLMATLIREDDRFASVRLAILERSAEESAAEWAAAGFDARIGASTDAAALREVFEDQPVAAPSDSPGSNRELSGADRADGPVILIVEDNEINLEVACAMIASLGYQCDQARDGSEAVVLVGRKHYDFVLMDCQMPGMDGYEAARQIRNREDSFEGAGRVPIVALTANAVIGDRERCLAAGMDDYLSKPVNTAELAAMISKWLTMSDSAPHETVAHTG